MVALKWLLVILGIGLFGSAGALVVYDVYVASQLRRLLKRKSEEEGGVAGLGLAPGRAVRLRYGRIPRIGWAPVEPGGETFWFAHSYAAETAAATATSEGLTAIVEHGSFVGVQFHPEKSGAAGARFLTRCLSRV